MPHYNYDVIIVGAGPAGYITAARAAKLGLKTAIVERSTWGGVCLNIGCIPTKTLLKNAKVFNYINHAEKYGIELDKKKVNVNWSDALIRKEKVVKQLTDAVQYLMRTNKVDSLIGTASAIDKNTIKVVDNKNNSQSYTTQNLIIATGSEVKMFNNPNGPQGLSTSDLKSNQHLLTSTEILSLKQVPKSLTIIGGGVIGVEFACLFSNLGTKVTIIEYLDNILGLLDLDIGKELHKSLAKNDVTIITGHSVSKLEKNTLTYFANTDKQRTKPFKITSDYILLSTGRSPITTGFENISIQIKPNGAFATNTKLEALDKDNKIIENLYVIGDANGEKMLAHVASAQGLIAVNNIVAKIDSSKFKEKQIDYNKMPNCIYTFPEASSVGLTEKEAKTTYPDCIVKKLPFAISGKALADGETEGFVKLIADRKHGTILGAHMVGSTATDLISEIVNIMNSEATIVELANSCHPHPTLSELVMDVAQDIELTFFPKINN